MEPTANEVKAPETKTEVPVVPATPVVETPAPAGGTEVKVKRVYIKHKSDFSSLTVEQLTERIKATNASLKTETDPVKKRELSNLRVSLYIHRKKRTPKAEVVAPAAPTPTDVPAAQ